MTADADNRRSERNLSAGTKAVVDDVLKTCHEIYVSALAVRVDIPSRGEHLGALRGE